MMNPRFRSLGIGWIFLCLALALHVYDEATTGFLEVYNPTVLSLRGRLGWWPMPTFSYDAWLYGLISGCVVLFSLSLAIFCGVRWLRIPAAMFAGLMLLNAFGHMFFTMLGHTVSTVCFARPAPGFWSSPFLAAASIYFLVQFWKTFKTPLSASTSA